MFVKSACRFVCLCVRVFVCAFEKHSAIEDTLE